MRLLAISALLMLVILPLTTNAGEKYLLRDIYDRKFVLKKEDDSPEEKWRLFIVKEEKEESVGCPYFVKFHEETGQVHIGVAHCYLLFTVVEPDAA